MNRLAQAPLVLVVLASLWAACQDAADGAADAPSGSDPALAPDAEAPVLNPAAAARLHAPRPPRAARALLPPTADCTTGCGLVVHEWGTFTSVQGSDGTAVPGLHHEDEALPQWVYRRNLADPYNYYFETLPEEPLQQLETPVLYFHAPERMDVSVRVAFPDGIVGQWYPDATAFLPAQGEMVAIADGTMTWNVTLDPAIDPASFIAVSPDEIWAPSRAVRSTPLRSTNPYGGIEHEQFIFYRGLGMFDPPIRVTATADGRLSIANRSPDALPAVFLLRVTGDRGTLVPLGALEAGGALDAPAPEATATLTDFSDQARHALGDALRQTGLYADEAQAMVDTWTRSWFGNEGLRVLYLAPPAWADALLPTRVTPEPGEFLRTFVGRIEVLTPADEQALRDALEAGEHVTPGSLGRFAEPRLRRALATITDPKAHAACLDLVAEAHALQ